MCSLVLMLIVAIKIKHANKIVVGLIVGAVVAEVKPQNYTKPT